MISFASQVAMSRNAFDLVGAMGSQRNRQACSAGANHNQRKSRTINDLAKQIGVGRDPVTLLLQRYFVRDCPLSISLRK